MSSFAGGRIEAFVGPKELRASDNLEEVIVDFIAGAKTSLDIAVQELDSLPIAQAILDARWRGVSIRMVLEQDYLQDRKKLLAPTEPGETPDQARVRAQWTTDQPPRDLDMNRFIFSALLRNNIHASADYNPDIFHQKFILRDYRTSASATSALLTGSTNFTHTDTHANLNHVVVFRHAAVCRAYRKEFDQIRRGSFGRGGHGDVPKVISISGVPVKILFAPDHTPELEIMKQINKCEKRIDFAIFTFAGSSGIDDALILAKQAKRKVRGVLDPTQAKPKWAATKWLHEAGIQLFVPKRTPPFRKLHHKLMVIDDATTIAGSFNYTAPANDYNDENIFVIGSPYADLGAEGGKVDQQECAAIAQSFRSEIDRIIKDLSEPYNP